MHDVGGGGGAVSDSGLAPFDKHPASPSELEELANRFTRLAERGIDQEAVTSQRARLAEANWDGLAAPELRAAPKAIRDQAQETTSALSWMSRPLAYWREQIQQFNSQVAELQEGLANARASNWGLTGEFTNTELYVARMRFEREQRNRWWKAYRTYIEEGSATTASMMRNGPTEEHLRLLRDAGLLDDVPLSVAVFMPTWHDQAMARLADELSTLVDKINDPNYRPTEEELTRLAEMLEQYADDEAFAYYFLTEIGPEGLLKLTGNVALMQSGFKDYVDGDLAKLVGTIQAGLGVALATATARRGTPPAYPGEYYQPGQYELPSTWKIELLQAGQQQHYLVMPHPGAADITLDVYGYQLLGVLLQSPKANFDSDFLALVGGDMLHFELNEGWSAHGEGIPRWYDVQNKAVWGTLPLKLNWIEGGQGNNGFDPMIGLLSALERNPDAARTFFTNQILYDGTEGGRLPRVDYLLTDRMWIPDTHERVEGLPGLRLLGDVLVKATTEDPDPRAHRIAQSIIYELTTDEQAYGYRNDPTGQGRHLGEKAGTFREIDVIPPELRGAMAQITTYYIDDMFFNLKDFAPPEDMPADWDVKVSPRQAQMFLADLAKNPEARDQVATAATIYASIAYDYYLSPEGAPTVAERLEEADRWVSDAAGRLFGALDFGHASSTMSEQSNEDSDYNKALRNKYFLAGLVVDNIPKVPGPVGSIVGEMMSRAEEAAQANRTGDVNYQIGEIREAGRENLKTMANAALYRNLTPAQIAELPSALTVDGKPVPLEEWSSEQWDAWERHVSRRGSELDAVADAAKRYNEGYDQARQDLEGYW
ncbi:MAG TPA: hypothetical protein VKZ67_09105 [Natronosporangium sp.]|nr:hypothetical protein [Natronosporangium sp.]